jgi:hypothetical protein
LESVIVTVIEYVPAEGLAWLIVPLSLTAHPEGKDEPAKV